MAIDEKLIKTRLARKEGGEKMQNKKGALDHLKNHQKYPASKAELLAECDSLSDFSDDDKKWFADHLKGDSYNSAEDVIKALGL